MDAVYVYTKVLHLAPIFYNTEFQGAVGSLCVRPCMLPPVDYSGTAQLLKLKPGTQTQLLFLFMHLVCDFGLPLLPSFQDFNICFLNLNH